MMKLLISKGADVNIESPYGFALDDCIRYGNFGTDYAYYDADY